MDETYVRAKGKWCYLYRAIDADGNLVNSRLSEKRDMEAAHLINAHKQKEQKLIKKYLGHGKSYPFSSRFR